MTEWRRPDGHRVSDDPELLDIDRLHRWLSEESYWAAGRPRETTEAAVAHSVNLGLYRDDGTQVGFCRWVTDAATFAWLCDVFVDRAHRGEGLGVFLVGAAVSHPDVQDLRLLLGTADAHTLYRKFGFETVARPERLMEVPRPALPTPSGVPAPPR